MITIYANWSQNALVSGATLDDAIARLTLHDVCAGTRFGFGVCDLTALYTGRHPIEHTGSRSAYLVDARRLFPAIECDRQVFPSH